MGVKNGANEKVMGTGWETIFSETSKPSSPPCFEKQWNLRAIIHEDEHVLLRAVMHLRHIQKLYLLQIYFSLFSLKFPSQLYKSAPSCGNGGPTAHSPHRGEETSQQPCRTCLCRLQGKPHQHFRSKGNEWFVLVAELKWQILAFLLRKCV